MAWPPGSSLWAPCDSNPHVRQTLGSTPITKICHTRHRGIDRLCEHEAGEWCQDMTPWNSAKKSSETSLWNSPIPPLCTDSTTCKVSPLLHMWRRCSLAVDVDRALSWLLVQIHHLYHAVTHWWTAPAATRRPTDHNHRSTDHNLDLQTTTIDLQTTI